MEKSQTNTKAATELSNKLIELGEKFDGIQNGSPARLEFLLRDILFELIKLRHAINDIRSR